MLSRDTILAAFNNLSVELGMEGVTGELNVIGGTAMVLAFDARNATKDVDAVFAPSDAVRSAAAKVAGQLNLPGDWLNDGAKGFLSPAGDFVELAALDFPNLRVLAPTAEYMLAMKVLASRVGAAPAHGDARDIAFLIRLLNLEDSAQVMSIVSRYYDPSRILPRSYYLVDEIMEEIQAQ